MFIDKEVSRSSVANGGFGDPNLTPKPLRISKREQVGTNAVTVNSSFSIRKSQTHHDLHTLAPSKTCSTRVNNSQLDLSGQDLAAPSSQWARRNTFLHVHKQRHSEPIYTNTAALTATAKEPIGFSNPPFNPHARSRDSCPTMGQLGNGLNASEANTVTRPAATRAFTTGAYSRPYSLSPVHEISSSSPSASPALREGQRRVVTNVEALYKDLTFKPLPHPRLHKQHSRKNSLMSRMMSGLTNMAHGSNATPRGDASQMPQNTSPATQFRTSSREDVRAPRRSSSSTATWGSDIHDLVSAFPTPPISCATSPTTINSRPSIRPKILRELCTPTDAAMMGAELTLNPEYDHLSSEKGQSMLVSLDIKGTTNSTSSVQDVWSQHTGLDVVVVIDNSLYTSPTTLMASCETARFLASMLNATTDRMAILCTSAIDTSGANSSVVMDLSRVKKHRIKSALDGITVSTGKPKINAWAWHDTINSAKELILNSMEPDPEDEVLQDTSGHIFLLTQDADRIPFQSLAHERLTFHIITPIGAPRDDQSSIQCNGWKLRSLSGDETRAVSTTDSDPTSLSNQLRVLIPQARSGKLLGSLTDLVLEVSAGPDCTIEGLIGEVQFTKLHPGEIVTALFKLRVPAARVQGHCVSRTPTPSSETLINSKDVLSKLDKIFGTTVAKILTARLTYKHSLLPAGTTCFVTTECHIKRPLPNPDQMPNPSKLNLVPQAGDCTVLVQKRLAYHLATHRSPKKALATLHNEFGDRFQYTACPSYVHFLAKELKSQARIVERLEIEASPKKSFAVRAPSGLLESRSPSSPGAERYKSRHRATDNSFENRSHISPGDENHKQEHRATASPLEIRSPNSPGGEQHKPQRRAANSLLETRNPSSPGAENNKPQRRATTDIPTAELFQAQPALTALSAKDSREQLRTDEARRIWGDMRKMKGSPNQSVPSRSLSSPVVEAQNNGIRELAVRNKRSMGTDSLRSMFSQKEGTRKGLGAPWM